MKYFIKLHEVPAAVFSTSMSTFIHAKEVVIYTSLDQVFSAPILKAYEKSTNVKVKAVFDVEAAKTPFL